MTADTYAILEFQGYVANVPSFDKETATLRFAARPNGKPIIQFIAKGEAAKAFKSILHIGALVQILAIPVQRAVDHNGSKALITEWVAKSIKHLGRRRKIDLAKFADVAILDGLMPSETEIEDVGYIEPLTFERFMERRKEALGEKKQDDDQNL